MVDCMWPEDPLEPWHVVFQSSHGEPFTPYTAATSYGKLVVDLGLADKYILLGVSDSKSMEYHCIPQSGNYRSAAYYWSRIFDSNTGSC